MNEDRTRCAHCDGSRLERGLMDGAAFKPHAYSLFGYNVSGYVCLDCGHLELYVSENQLEKMRKKSRIT